MKKIKIELKEKDVKKLPLRTQLIVRSELRKVQKNIALADKYIDEAQNGKEDEPMNITCDDFAKVAGFFQSCIFLASSLPSFRKKFHNSYIREFNMRVNGIKDAGKEGNGAEDVLQKDIEKVTEWAKRTLQETQDVIKTVYDRVAQTETGETVECTIEELNDLKTNTLCLVFLIGADPASRESFRKGALPMVVEKIKREIRKEKISFIIDALAGEEDDNGDE